MIIDRNFIVNLLFWININEQLLNVSFCHWITMRFWKIISHYSINTTKLNLSFKESDSWWHLVVFKMIILHNFSGRIDFMFYSSKKFSQSWPWVSHRYEADLLLLVTVWVYASKSDHFRLNIHFFKNFRIRALSEKHYSHILAEYIKKEIQRCLTMGFDYFTLDFLSSRSWRFTLRIHGGGIYS